MKILRFWKFILAIIVIASLFLRVYRISQVPPSLSWDEVSIGYNAYSILKTGFDEHHRFMPLDTFTAFGDYKPPLAIYLTIPAVALFGLTELAVRLPSAIAGTLTVLLSFFLVFELLKSRYEQEAVACGLVVSIILGISPWHLQLSRAGFEANIALFFMVLGVVGFLVARQKANLLRVAWLPFVAASYTFNSSRYVAPLVGILVTMFCWQVVKRNMRLFLTGVVIGFFALVPILPHLLSKEARLRFTEVNIFTDLSVITTANDRIETDGISWWAKILHNRRVGFARSYLIHFFDNIEPRFLFGKGDGNPKFSIQDVGQLYLVELPLLLIGIFWLFARERRVVWLLVLWIVSAIIPAATARETPHALRVENSLPVWQIIIGYGTVALLGLQKTSLRKWVVLLIIGFLYIGNVSYYFHNYYNHYGREYSGEWQFGYREAILYASAMQDQYNKIVLSENIGRPYIYVLFYERFDPAASWKSTKGSFDEAGFYNVSGVGKYQFVRSAPMGYEKHVLYILPPEQVPTTARVLKVINLLNKRPVLTIFDI